MRPSSVLLLVTGWFVVLGSTAWTGVRTPDPEKAAQAIRKAGGALQEDDSPGKPIVVISFEGPWVTVADKDLVHLRAFPTLKGVILEETRITDRGLKYLRGLPRVQHVFIYKSLITDEGVRIIKGLCQLRS
jgi:hypothetical protein